jgi:peptidoglycan/LPS O-acetylase OafA/YrhL
VSPPRTSDPAAPTTPHTPTREAFPAGPAPRRFRPDIEGLRAVAVLLVVLFHAGVPGISGGYIGVDLFFVISGYLITGLLLREHATTGRISLRSFYARRARRILPASTLTLAVTAAASYLVLGAVRARDVYVDGLWSALFGANIRFAMKGTNYLASQAAPSPLQHFWSLAVEEQFYLLWPTVLVVTAVIAERHLRAALAVLLTAACAASLTWSVIETASNAPWAYFSPATRAWELGAGALLAVAAPFVARLPRLIADLASAAGLILIGVAAVTFSTATVFPGYAAALPVAGGVLILGAGTASARTLGERALGSWPLRQIGKLSYSWYLLHWPVLIIVAAKLGHPLTVTQGLACAVGSLAGAALTYAALENPVRRAKTLVASPGASLALGVILTTVTALAYNGLSIVSNTQEHTGQVAAASETKSIQAAPLASEATILAEVAAAQRQRTLSAATTATLPAADDDKPTLERDGCEVATAVTAVPPAASCVYGDPRGARTMVLFGDSHVSMWEPALNLVGKRRGWKIYVIAKSACPDAEVRLRNHDLNRDFTECTAWRTAAIAAIVAIKPNLLVMSSNGLDGVLLEGEHDLHGSAADHDWQEGLEATLRQVTPAAGRTVIIGDIPSLGQSAPECVAAHIDDVQACAAPRTPAVPVSHDVAEQAAASTEHAGYVNVTNWLCGTTECPAVIDGIVVYYNQYHVSATYAEHLAGPLASALGL